MGKYMCQLDHSKIVYSICLQMDMLCHGCKLRASHRWIHSFGCRNLGARILLEFDIFDHCLQHDNIFVLRGNVRHCYNMGQALAPGECCLMGKFRPSVNLKTICFQFIKIIFFHLNDSLNSYWITNWKIHGISFCKTLHSIWSKTILT